jgi:dihydroneopterin aldolase
VKLSYSSAIAAATADDVSLSIDYGKLYRRIESEVQNAGKSDHHLVDLTTTTTATTKTADAERAKRADILLGHDVRILAALVADCALGLLDETIAGVRRMAHVHTGSPSRRRASQASRRLSSGSYNGGNANITNERAGPEPLDATFGECEVSVHLPGAHLRAEGGLTFRSVTTWGYDRSSYGSADDAVESSRQTLVVDQEFRVEGIRCYCILGVNSHERLEKQCVVVTLVFRGSGEPAWGSTVVDTYQEMVKVVAEVSYPFFGPLFQ